MFEQADESVWIVKVFTFVEKKCIMLEKGGMQL